RIGNVEPEVARRSVERDPGNDLADHKSVESQRTRLLGTDRPAKLARILLQAVVIKRAKLLNGYLGTADFRYRRATEPSEDVADPPDGKADNQKADHGSHDGLAEPVGGSFSQTSQHPSSTIAVSPCLTRRAPHHRQRHLAPQHAQPQRCGMRWHPSLWRAFNRSASGGNELKTEASMPRLSRRPLIAGNWKMNGLHASLAELAKIIDGARGLAAV